MIPYNQELGSFLKSAREKVGLTQKEVAEKLNLNTVQIISNWERGRCAIPKDRIPAIVSLYGIDQNKLYKSFSKAIEKELKVIIYGN